MFNDAKVVISVICFFLLIFPFQTQFCRMLYVQQTKNMSIWKMSCWTIGTNVHKSYLTTYFVRAWKNLRKITIIIHMWIHSHNCTVDVFAIFSPVFSLRIFYKKHAKNHTSNKPRAFKICVQLSFDKLIWYTKFHKDWSTRRQKHHWSKFFDGLVKYRTENRKTVHCAVVTCLPKY